MEEQKRPKWMYPVVLISVVILLFYPQDAPFSTWVKWLAVGGLLGSIVKIMTFIPSKSETPETFIEEDTTDNK